MVFGDERFCLFCAFGEKLYVILFFVFCGYCFNIRSNDARVLSYNETGILSICPIILTIA